MNNVKSKGVSKLVKLTTAGVLSVSILCALSGCVTEGTSGNKEETTTSSSNTASKLPTDKTPDNYSYPLNYLGHFDNTESIKIMGLQSYARPDIMSEEYTDKKTKQSINAYYTATDAVTFLIKESIRLGWGKPVTHKEVKDFIDYYNLDKEVVYNNKTALLDVVHMLQLNKAVVPFFKEYYGEDFTKEKADFRNNLGLIIQGDSSKLDVNSLGNVTKALTKKGTTITDNFRSATKVLDDMGDSVSYSEIQFNSVMLNAGVLTALGVDSETRDILMSSKTYAENVIFMPDIVSIDTGAEVDNKELEDKNMTTKSVTAFYSLYSEPIAKKHENILKVSQLINKDIEENGLDGFYSNLLKYLKPKGVTYTSATTREVTNYIALLDEYDEDELKEMLEDGTAKDMEETVQQSDMFRLQTAYTISDMLTYAFQVEGGSHQLSATDADKTKVK